MSTGTLNLTDLNLTIHELFDLRRYSV